MKILKNFLEFLRSLFSCTNTQDERAGDFTVSSEEGGVLGVNNLTNYIINNQSLEWMLDDYRGWYINETDDNHVEWSEFFKTLENKHLLLEIESTLISYTDYFRTLEKLEGEEFVLFNVFYGANCSSSEYLKSHKVESSYEATLDYGLKVMSSVVEDIKRNPRTSRVYLTGVDAYDNGTMYQILVILK